MSTPEVVRVAMWSGPRNISTAMLRSWEARPDTFVCDEPLYGHYLVRTGLPHPGAEEIVAHHETEWARVIDALLGPVPDGRTIFYQKHMAHHLPPGVSLDWVFALRNCFLIRNPAEMLTSLARVIPHPAVDETGLPQQVELFERVRDRLGQAPPVLDARDVLEDPPGMLSALCRRLGVPFTESMLSWSPGPRDTDGIWARHWYASVEQSTGFAPYTPRDDAGVPEHLRGVLDECEAFYGRLYGDRIVV